MAHSGLLDQALHAQLQWVAELGVAVIGAIGTSSSRREAVAVELESSAAGAVELVLRPLQDGDLDVADRVTRMAS